MGASPHDRNYWSDNVTITNVGTISMGGIDTSDSRNGGTYARPHGGHITIGAAQTRAGEIRIGYIYADARNSASAAYAAGGDISIFGSGNVAICDSAGNRGDIRTDSPANNAGDVTIEHVGSLTVRDILAQTSGTGATALGAAVKLRGGNSSGDLVARNVANYNLKIGYISAGRPLIEVKKYNNVTLDSIDGHTPHPTDGRASDAVIADGIAGNITVNGPVDLSHGGIRAYCGTLSLVCSGMVTLALLDLTKVQSAQLTSGMGKSLITGVLADFAPASTGGTGTVSAPYLTTQTVLRASSGQIICYTASETNAYLNGKVYKIADLAGAAAQGGLLMPRQAAQGGAVLSLR
jgi:hypothetical protein